VCFPKLEKDPFCIQNYEKLHNHFNKTLLPECVQRICEYLSPNDIINMGISKLFLPAMLQLKYFYRVVYKHFVHTCLLNFTARTNLYITAVCVPFVYNTSFYFAFETSKIFMLKDFLNFRCKNDFNYVTIKFSQIFKPFATYKKSFNQSTYHECDKKYLCHTCWRFNYIRKDEYTLVKQCKKH
jgi:hypothetical protein